MTAHEALKLADQILAGRRRYARADLSGSGPYWIMRILPTGGQQIRYARRVSPLIDLYDSWTAEGSTVCVSQSVGESLRLRQARETGSRTRRFGFDEGVRRS